MEQALLRKELLSNIFLKGIKEINLPKDCRNICEIRIRTNRPVMFCESSCDWFLDISGNLSKEEKNLYITDEHDLNKTVQLVARNSIYAYQEEMINGFITIRGGHRVGIVGKTITEKKKIINLTDFAGLNFRISRSIPGCARDLLKYIVHKRNVLNTLIISPPGCGKTTILRDVARNLSNGITQLNFVGKKVGIVDERSEISASFKGTPRHDVGIRTDVLDNCPKEQGILMLLRTMSPQVIITDEIGGDSDLYAIKKSINAGVKIISSFHGFSMNEAKGRVDVLKIMRQEIFDRIIFLSFANGPGTLEEVFDTTLKDYIYKRSNDV